MSKITQLNQHFGFKNYLGLGLAATVFYLMQFPATASEKPNNFERISHRITTESLIAQVPLVATPGNDVITGTPGNDTLNGKGGNDTIITGDGYDTVIIYYSGCGVNTVTDFTLGQDQIVMDTCRTSPEDPDNILHQTSSNRRRFRLSKSATSQDGLHYDPNSGILSFLGQTVAVFTNKPSGVGGSTIMLKKTN